MNPNKKSLGAELFYYFNTASSVKHRQKSAIADNEQSSILPHSPIESLAPDLWHVTGTMPNGLFPPREMIIFRLSDGSLLIHSAIALQEEAMITLESLGMPKLLIVPNRIHRLDAAVYKKRYPQILVVCPSVAKPFVEEVVKVDEVAEEILPNYGIICHVPAGIRPQELAYELPLSTGKALLFTDILFNLTGAYLNQYAPKSQPMINWIGTGGFFGITGLGKLFYMTDKKAYRQWLEELANIPNLQVISVAHGSPILTECNQKLREAASRLL
ncbi:conserved hypothetical protein [Gloeothece citriformis PCC 7424]|uniref:DUF4336 domain-containing protein n=1 Tax=Gloeothece citriformis (strain PCC 7424) TaxID=65393 RepID=B7KAC0_GLOC7|nr:hypothetical protein [Gloeothece citriformis]ACK72894.1 conserved hypothetical protein [Gloeothece citriformis PCC 7424]